MDWLNRIGRKKPDKSQTQREVQAREAESEDFAEIGGSPVPGITLRYILRGHTGAIGRMAWSPDGRYLASPSEDKTTRVWELEHGNCVAVLRGHEETVYSVAWSPDGSMLASGGSNFEINIWESEIWSQLKQFSFVGGGAFALELAWSPDGQAIFTANNHGEIPNVEVRTGKQVRSITKLSSMVSCVGWAPNGDTFSSATQYSAEILLWDRKVRKRLRSIKPESGTITCMTWSPDSRLLAFGSNHGLIEVYEAQTGKTVYQLEAHTDSVKSLSFSHDGRFLASKSDDKTVCIRRTDGWQIVATLAESTLVQDRFINIAFHPSTLCLATFGANDNEVRLWDLDAEVLLNASAGQHAGAKPVYYTAARLVLVGDSGVGKTGLGWRMAKGEFREHSSTHGQQFWVVDELRYTRKDGTECEAVLWDLAGQPVYRPVHAIFLDDVDLSLVLFDPTNRTEPLKGAEFWLEQLAGKKSLPPSVLVGARTDRGTAVMSQEELRQFCQRRGISGGYVSTSAATGEGLDALLKIIREQIPWEQMTTTVTTVTFKRIKEYVLELKEKPDRKGVLVRPEELRTQLEAKDEGWEFTDAEMMTAVRHLATHGYVAVLRSSSGGEFILLTPELLVDLASSIVLQADKHPRDLGALSETDLLRGVYNLPELAGLEQAEQQILLDAAVARFLSHSICFRESLGADALLIFPGLIKQKRPLFDEVETTDDVSYVVRGRVENVYAALVVLLGYTQTFTRVNQWQSQAQYQLGEGQICGFRLIEEREGEIELVLYHSAAMPAYGRATFQGLFEQFLYQRDVEVKRLPPVVCRCGQLQQRATVLRRIREGKEFLSCEECGEKIPLPEIEKPQALGAQVSRRVQRAEATARLRSTYETHLVRIKGFRRDRTPPRCYLSHAPEQSAWASQLARDLRDAGAYVVEDRAQVGEEDFLLLVGTRAYKEACGRAGDAVAEDAELAKSRLREPKAGWPNVIPLLLEGEPSASLPRGLRDCQPGVFRDETRHAVSLFDLVLTLYAIQLDHPAFVPLRESLSRQWEQTLAEFAQSGREVFISYAWGGESEQVAEELERALAAGGVKIVRDKRALGFKGGIKEFMEDIGRGRCVVLVVGDKYLKSPNCLFELVQVSKHGEFSGRIFPVVLSDARIYDARDRLGYVEYWEQRREELNEAIRRVSAENLQGFREDIDLYAEIRKLLPELTNVLKNMNTLTADSQRASGFKDLFEAVMERLGD